MLAENYDSHSLILVITVRHTASRPARKRHYLAASRPPGLAFIDRPGPGPNTPTAQP
jgi:hypothetical protein|eukprot:COSAG06_NODE_830_length_12041_cov_41.249372_5_plen_57_part_00